MTHIAIVGAGLAGLVLARRMQERAEVTVLEKSRSLGGRMATRRYSRYQFDHGAPYFRARTEAFRVFIASQIEQGVVAPWPARVVEIAGGEVVRELAEDPDVPRLVAMPGMNGLGRHLASGLNVKRQRPVERLVRRGLRWRLLDKAGRVLTEADWVVVTAPAPQARRLLPEGFVGESLLETIRMRGCFALMLGLGRTLSLDWQGARVSRGPVRWIAVDSSKPGRPKASSLVVHAAQDWSDALMEEEPADIEAAMIEAASEVAGEVLADADVRRLHRWRYARSDARIGLPGLIDPDTRLAACGDWCVDGVVEGAFTSAMGLAARLEQSL